MTTTTDIANIQAPEAFDLATRDGRRSAMRWLLRQHPTVGMRELGRWCGSDHKTARRVHTAMVRAGEIAQPSLRAPSPERGEESERDELPEAVETSSSPILSAPRGGERAPKQPVIELERVRRLIAEHTVRSCSCSGHYLDGRPETCSREYREMGEADRKWLSDARAGVFTLMKPDGSGFYVERTRPAPLLPVRRVVPIPVHRRYEDSPIDSSGWMR